MKELRVFVLASVLCSSFVCCGVYEPALNSSSRQRPEAINLAISNSGSTKSDQNGLQVADFRLFAWWWSESDAKLGINTSNPPAKVYREIQSWEYDGEGITTSPHQIDIVADINNDTTSVFEGRLKFVVAMRFENLEGTKVGSWEKEREIYYKVISIAANEKQTFKLEKFDLTKLLNAKRNGRYLDALLFKVLVLDGQGGRIEKKEKELMVKLGD